MRVEPGSFLVTDLLTRREEKLLPSFKGNTDVLVPPSSSRDQHLQGTMVTAETAGYPQICE